MRFACVRIEHLPTRLEASLQPELSDQPLVLLRAWDECVLDITLVAEASGVRPGELSRTFASEPALAEQIVAQVYAQCRQAIHAAFVVVDGVVQKDHGAINVLAASVNAV
jgi:hypothetical protein